VRALIATLVIGVLLVAGAFALTRARDDDDDPVEAVAMQTATREAELTELAALRGTPAATAGADTAAAGSAAASPSPQQASPTAAVEASATPTEEPEEPTPTPRSRPRTGEMLPEPDEVPEGFVQTEDGRFTEEEVANSFRDPADAATRLAEWDWREGISRTFELSPDVPRSPEDTVYLYVSVHRFGTDEGASQALEYFSTDISELRDLRTIEAGPLGDEMVALAGGDAETNEVSLYIRDGARLVRIAAFSEAGDSLDDALDLAQIVLQA
jgi:hypothetical protein